jgi:hypothetical protein
LSSIVIYIEQLYFFYYPRLWNIIVNHYIDRKNLKLGLFSTFWSIAVYLVLVKHVLSGSFWVLALNNYIFFIIRACLNKGNNKITEQSYKGKVKPHNYINRQNQSTTGKLWSLCRYYSHATNSTSDATTAYPPRKSEITPSV